MSNFIEGVVDFVEKEAYTDIFLRPSEFTRLKTPRGWIEVGELTKSNPSAVSGEVLESLVAQLSGRENWLNDMTKTSESFAFMVPLDQKGARLRIKVARCTSRAGSPSKSNKIDYTVNIRKLPAVIPVLQKIGLPRSVEGMLTPAGGLVIVTGPVCSGKSTTLASMIEHINGHRRANIITLESLAEYIFASNKSIITQRTVPTDVATFFTGIKDALDGQAVDVLMIGEVVDKEAMDAMLSAAESGHLVLATMHARNAVGAVSRIADMFSGDEQRLRLSMLADKLTGVIAQRLLPNVSGTGYELAYEILSGTTAVRDLIRSNQPMKLQNVIEQGADDGMCSLNRVLVELVRAKKIDASTALEVTHDESELRSLLGR